jgi:hypothetical protein
VVVPALAFVPQTLLPCTSNDIRRTTEPGICSCARQSTQAANISRHFCVVAFFSLLAAVNRPSRLAQQHTPLLRFMFRLAPPLIVDNCQFISIDTATNMLHLNRLNLQPIKPVSDCMHYGTVTDSCISCAGYALGFILHLSRPPCGKPHFGWQLRRPPIRMEMSSRWLPRMELLNFAAIVPIRCDNARGNLEGAAPARPCTRLLAS